MPTPTSEFKRLIQKAAACRICPKLAEQPAILSSGNGSLSAQVVFVAEAPGRFGAGRTGIPFSGDQSGKNFETLLNHIGWTREEVFITNAVLCNPLENGNNRRPTAGEIRNCGFYLGSVLEIIRPNMVVTLGAVGLEAVNHFLGTKHQLAKNIARPIATEKFTLVPLYHPSPRVIHTRRSLIQQKRDFKKIASTLSAMHPSRPCDGSDGASLDKPPPESYVNR
ncbi:MAG: uracil-DNA glycosylase [Nitrospinaceae bacterium]|nr:MAG: uracil-DNA glycosylase [Nitrospinaceae bacterium]